jgi:hypothetical protein
MPKVLQTSAMRQIQRVSMQGTADGLSDAQLLERFAAETAGTLPAAPPRSMTVRMIETAVAIALTIGVAVFASVLAGKPAEPPGHRQHDRTLPAKFDKELSSRILPVGKEEPLFVDFDTGHFLSPPFALEPVDRDRPPALSNLAFPDRLKDWVRRHGIDAVVQTDGRTITLLGLEMKDGQPVPNPNTWPRLTPADALGQLDRFPDRPRRPDDGEWARFVREFQPEDPPVVLPFLTREGSLGLLGLRLDRAEPKDAGGIRLTFQVGRGLVPRAEDLATGRPVRRPPAQALLDDRDGPVHLQTWKGGIVLTRPGSPEWIEIDRGKVVVKVNRAGISGPADAAETVIEAARLVTDVMDLDGRHLRVTLIGSSRGMVCRRVRDRLEIGEVDLRLLAHTLIVKPNPIISCDRIILDLPNFAELSKDPRGDGIRTPRRR